MCPRAERLEAWRRLAQDLDPGKLAGLTEEIAFGDVIDTAGKLIAGSQRGRVVVPIAPKLA